MFNLIIVHLLLPVRSTEEQYIMYLYHTYLPYFEVSEVKYLIILYSYSARVRPTPLGFYLSPETKNPGKTPPQLRTNGAAPPDTQPSQPYFYPQLQPNVRVKWNVLRILRTIMCVARGDTLISSLYYHPLPTKRIRGTACATLRVSTYTFTHAVVNAETQW